MCIRFWYCWSSYHVIEFSTSTHYKLMPSKNPIFQNQTCIARDLTQFAGRVLRYGLFPLPYHLSNITFYLPLSNYTLSFAQLIDNTAIVNWVFSITHSLTPLVSRVSAFTTELSSPRIEWFHFKKLKATHWSIITWKLNMAGQNVNYYKTLWWDHRIFIFNFHCSSCRSYYFPFHSTGFCW